MSKSDGKYHARRGFPADEFFGPFETLSEAQDAAQADYSARILSAIDPAFLNALSEATSARDEAINQLSSRTHDRDSQQRVAMALLERAERAEAERDAAVGALKFERTKIIDAWEALVGGKQTPVHAVEKWLIEVMAPAINDLRRARSQEDSV